MIFELDNKKLVVFLFLRVGFVIDCEFWEGYLNILYGRRYKYGNNYVYFFIFYCSFSVEVVELLNFLDKRVVGLICGKGLWEKSLDFELLFKKELVLNVVMNDLVVLEICIFKESNC